MENQEKIVIKLEDLPVRSEKLTQEKIVNVFGGCKDKGSECSKNSECCSNFCTSANRGGRHHYCFG